MRALRSRRSNLVVLGIAAIAAVTLLAGAAHAVADPGDDLEPDSLCAPGQAGVVYGTEGADTISGTGGDDVICGLGGDDRISGGGGNDVVDGGSGDDTISGGPGDDRLFGGDGNDTLDGSTGNDGLFGGAGDDTLDGAAGDDGLVGADGADTLSGAAGDDSLDGGSGDDALAAAAGDDVLDGGEGTDTLDAAAGTDVCRNGESLSGCEQGAEAFDALAQPLSIGAAPTAPPLTISVDDAFPGVALTIHTNGGIYPWDVHVTPARQHMAGRVVQAMAGPAFDVSVPASAPAIHDATLTLPYDPGRIGGASDSDLRIWTFDPGSQFWVPVQGAQTIDPVAHTVTANLTHFSVYAVLKFRTPEQWQAIFGKTPLRCTGGGSASGIDVVFLVDISGSMASNDPSGLRVDGAKAFVEAMRPQDRAAVVGFDSSARREIGLTALDTQAGVDDVEAALERTRVAVDGTNISVAVREAISILSANGGEGRLRVAILLTDGQSPYDTSLTTQAASQAIEIHTVGLGSGTDAALLQGIADGTGATYRHLDDAAELPGLYRQLAGDIIGDSTDTDHDGLTDCVERNGLFVPISITFPFFGGGLDFASFLTTDPDNPDTDGDGIPDGQEVAAHDLLANPVLSSTYAFLVDQGLTTYYTLKSNPTLRDSDGDGDDDGLELLNGTDPLVPNHDDLGIEGLDLAAGTLFQPARYAQRPAIARILDTEALPDGRTAIKSVFYNETPVRYEDDRTCVETCDAIRTLAEARPDDNGWGICIFGIGDCVDDASQMRDIVEEARVAQGIFAGDGNLQENFLRRQVALQCAVWFQDAQHCFDEAAREDFPSDAGADDFTDWLAAGTIAIPAPGVANPEEAARIARILARTAAAVAAGVTAAALTDVVAQCVGGPALKELARQFLPFVHPCQQLPTYAPGGDVSTATQHRVDAIASVPSRVIELWASPAERTARAFGRRWYAGQPGCTAADVTDATARYGVPVSCDEFPNWAMAGAGPGASLREIPATDNSLEGTRLNLFFDACPDVTRPVRTDRLPFLVVPLPPAPATVFHCGSR